MMKIKLKGTKVMNAIAVSTRLTGNIYYRKSLFGRLILQVEEESVNKSGILTRGYRDADIDDAKALDLLECDYSKFIRRRVGVDSWLTGQVAHRSGLFSPRVVLKVEALDGGFVQTTFFKNAGVNDISPQLLHPVAN